MSKGLRPFTPGAAFHHFRKTSRVIVSSNSSKKFQRELEIARERIERLDQGDLIFPRLDVCDTKNSRGHLGRSRHVKKGFVGGIWHDPRSFRRIFNEPFRVRRNANHPVRSSHRVTLKPRRSPTKRK